MCEVVSKNIALKKQQHCFSPKKHCFSQKPIVFQHVHFFYPIVLKRKIITDCTIYESALCLLRTVFRIPLNTAYQRIAQLFAIHEKRELFTALSSKLCNTCILFN